MQIRCEVKQVVRVVDCLDVLLCLLGFRHQLSHGPNFCQCLCRGRRREVSIVGELFADNLNETQVSSYNLLNITYSKQIFNNSEIYLGVNNLLDVNYFDNIRINAFGKRYYEPAPKRNVHFGLNLSF